MVAVLTDQDGYDKTRNYWKYLKAKLKREGIQMVSATTQLKLFVLATPKDLLVGSSLSTQ